MNKIFLSLTMLFALSCNKMESLDQPDELGAESLFEVKISTSSYTKGAMVTEPKDMGSIGVFCAYTGGDKWSGATEFEMLDDRRFSISDDGDCVIDGDPVSWGYETLNDMYSVFAYSPHSDDQQGLSPRIENGELCIDYEVPTSSVDQPDVMFALPSKDISPQIVGGVPLSFCHALSCVSFGVVSSSGVKIESIEISGVYSQGTLKWDYDSAAPQWDLDTISNESFTVEVDDYTMDDDNPVQVNTDRGYLMMIPQLLTNGAQVTLLLDNGEQRDLRIPNDSEWVAGSKYHYVVDLDDGDSGFLFDSSQLSNCYIINPTQGEPTVVQIPIEDRINDFWMNYSGKGTNKITTSSTTDEFYVVMVWEDFDCDLSFSYEVLDDEDENMAVRLTIPEEFQEGNFVFAVQTYDSYNSLTTLWSWHLWFTDYNPDAIAAENRSKIEEGEFKSYTLDGYNGAVHRYKDDENSDECVWNGIYKDKFIMDRNIGERNEYASDYGAGAVYYQFGRKDPFPGNGAKYDSGDTQPGIRKSSGFDFYFSVEYYVDFFVSSSVSKNWCGETPARLFSCIWFDGNLPISGYSVGKSIFDPSPLGWRIPVIDTWSYFASYSSCDDVVTYDYYGWRDIDELGDPSLAQEAGFVWSATPVSSDTGYCFYFSDGQYTPLKEIYFTYGLPIRAIEE